MKNKKYSSFDYTSVSFAIILTSFFLYTLFFIFYIEPKNANKRKKSFLMTTGKIVGLAGDGKINKTYKYSFEISGKKREGTVCCPTAYERNLIGEPIIIVYETKNSENHEGLLKVFDFQKYNLVMPDSIYEIYLYGKSLK